MANGNQPAEGLVMWGERGLVTTLLHDLCQGNGWTRLLRATAPAANRDPIIKDNENVQNVWAVVEPGFGNRGFGSPDAIVRLTVNGANGERTIVLIIEAKRCPYLAAARHHAQHGQPGFNSSLNGQIELDARLAWSLANYNDETLAEADEIAQAYGEAEARSVGNAAVLGGVVPSIAGHGFENYRYLMITTDAENPLPRARQAGFYPVFHGDLQTAANRLHWISWQTIAGLMNALDGQNGGNRCRLFGPTYHLNEPNLLFPPEGAGAGGLPAQRGAAVVGLPNNNRLHFPPNRNNNPPQGNKIYWLHFSWLKGNARLRHYPEKNEVIMRQVETAHVINNLANDGQGALIFRCPQPRRPVDDTQYWHETLANRPPENAQRIKLQQAQQ